METMKIYSSPTTKIYKTGLSVAFCDEYSEPANPYLPSLSPENELWDEEEDGGNYKKRKSKWDD